MSRSCRLWLLPAFCLSDILEAGRWRRATMRPRAWSAGRMSWLGIRSAGAMRKGGSTSDPASGSELRVRDKHLQSPHSEVICVRVGGRCPPQVWNRQVWLGSGEWHPDSRRSFESHTCDEFRGSGQHRKRLLSGHAFAAAVLVELPAACNALIPNLPTDAPVLHILLAASRLAMLVGAGGLPCANREPDRSSQASVVSLN
jgi:hypothetical protein